jgi:predicted nucleic acid-binding protein
LSTVYVDTSCLVAIAFDEPGSRQLARKLEAADSLVASILLEAELRSAFAREATTEAADKLLSAIDWILPDRRLSREIDQVLSHGYLRGADLHHLACAIFLAGDARGVAFCSLDRRQAEVAKKLGFASA